jgi:uncharacterized protein (TIGR03118 family)
MHTLLVRWSGIHYLKRFLMLERILGISRGRQALLVCRPVSCRLGLEKLEDRTLPATAFLQTNLVSDVAGIAQFTDPNLRNPWGVAANPTGDFWIANAGSGTVTLYKGDVGGSAISRAAQVINLPMDPNQRQIMPSGEVYNNTRTFIVSDPGYTGPALFMVAGLDGTLTAIAPTFAGTTYTTAPAYQSQLVAATQGAVYTGLAIGTNSAGSFLFVANVAKGRIDVFNSSFQLVATAGSFTDPGLPTGYTPFNVAAIGNTLFVTYKNVLNPDIGGLVDKFDTNGNFLGRFAAGSNLNAPWAVVQAPANFGSYGNDILVGNFGDGRINAYDANGNYFGQLTGSTGQPIVIENLWQLTFGNGTSAGDAGKLYFTAGINGENDGLFGSIAPAVTTPPSFVSQAYLDLLGRQADAGGLAYWTGKLNSGLSRQQVVAGIQDSVEYRSIEVNGVYQRLLGRNAETTGLTFWIGQLQTGATVEQIAAGIAGSAEYFATRGGGTQAGFLNALFQDALGRAPDLDGVTFYTARMQAGATTAQVAMSVFSSTEFRTDRVISFYEAYLHRAPEGSGTAYWLAALNSGVHDETVIAAIMASDEYFARLGGGTSTATPTVTRQATGYQPPIITQGAPTTPTTLPNQFPPLPDQFQTPKNGIVWW